MNAIITSNTKPLHILKVALFNLEGTGCYDESPSWPGESVGTGDVSDWCICGKGEGFASGDFRLKVCRRDDNGGSKGTVILGLPVTCEGGAEERPYG
jgi:hypothetical protein